MRGGPGRTLEALRLTVTDAGHELLASTEGLLENAIRQRFGRIEPTRLRTLIEVLEQLRAPSINVEDGSSDETPWAWS